jgi:hypothetical protein
MVCKPCKLHLSQLHWGFVQWMRQFGGGKLYDNIVFGWMLWMESNNRNGDHPSFENVLSHYRRSASKGVTAKSAIKNEKRYKSKKPITISILG